MPETQQQYQARIAAWASHEYGLAAKARASKQSKQGDDSALYNPNASLAELAGAALAQSGVTDKARANMSAAQTARWARQKKPLIKMPLFAGAKGVEPLPPVSDDEFLRHEGKGAE